MLHHDTWHQTKVQRSTYWLKRKREHKVHLHKLPTSALSAHPASMSTTLSLLPRQHGVTVARRFIYTVSACLVRVITQAYPHWNISIAHRVCACVSVCVCACVLVCVSFVAAAVGGDSCWVTTTQKVFYAAEKHNRSSVRLWLIHHCWANVCSVSTRFHPPDHHHYHHHHYYGNHQPCGESASFTAGEESLAWPPLIPHLERAE